ncbi:SDR family NAD(P)-dependent oxidoreductase [Amnibacterium setariae]|uniref:SDR family oxidoreductase n=1 Tax=Amnibacterium setariae TaxID=2306585 RepID=A0A3A1TYH0_9MICO|nr:SDR family oxidoreductase [Amnibacterium setariae]RIX28631.1 SDR family oxidoreductase [Amnibacterium setariae]
MDLGLQDRTAFISGSTQGIGFAVARALASEGARVTLNGRDAERLSTAVARLRQEVPGAVVSGAVADFADDGQVEDLLAGLDDVDVLVNNVGLFDIAPLEAIADDGWRRYFDVNVLSGVRLSRRVLPGMISRRWGRIVFIASESGVDVPADMLHYGATKAATLAFANGLAKRTRGTAVTVNSVLGGPTYSDGVARAVERLASDQGLAVEDVKAAIAGSRPSLIERFIEPAEVANLVLYLASAASSATNGAALRAEGGVLPTVL